MLVAKCMCFPGDRISIRTNATFADAFGGTMAYSALSQTGGARFPEELAGVRGYEVRTRADDDKVGKDDDLVCTADGSIRYLDVHLGGFFNPRHVLLPIGTA